MTVLVVTGTGTDVGKTVVTAALAALAVDRGTSVTVLKPGQTGVAPDEDGDLAVVRRLAGGGDLLRTVELVRYPDPLSPAAAARLSGLPALDLAAVVQAVLDAGRDSDLVLVEGAGGLLVRYDEDGLTLADVARTLRAPVLVVADPGLGTLNTTALTLEALAHRGIELEGIVLGRWPVAPDEPDLAMRSNLADLEMLAARPLLGALPGASGALDPAAFLQAARHGLGPTLGGTFDARAFRRTWHTPPS